MSLREPGGDTEDAWGRDPRVRELRRVFAAMEDAEKVVLTRLGVDLLDPRLRDWRDEARTRFEVWWSEVARRGDGGDPRGLGEKYAECLGQVIGGRGGSM